MNHFMEAGPAQAKERKRGECVLGEGGESQEFVCGESANKRLTMIRWLIAVAAMHQLSAS